MTLYFAGCLRLTEQRDFVRLVRAVEMEMSILDDCPSQLMLCFDGASILSMPPTTVGYCMPSRILISDVYIVSEDKGARDHS